MLQEAIRSISELAQNAAGAENKISVVALPCEPPHVYGTVNAEGEFVKRYADPSPRQHMLRSVQEVDHFLQFATQILQVKPVVWISEARVVIILDDGALQAPRRERATLLFSLTPQFCTLHELEESEHQLTSKEMYRLIRRQLWETLDTPLAERLCKLFRSLAWTKTAQGGEERSAGRANYGQSVAAQVTLGGEPVNLESVQNLTLHVRVYSDPMLTTKRTVKAILEDDPENQRFAIVPLPGELQRAREEELEGITTLIRDLCTASEIPCFYGEP